jgi:hypothetical protein
MLCREEIAVLYEQNVELSGVSVKLRKAAISVVMPVCFCPSVRPPARPPARKEQFGSHRTDFHGI